MFHHVIVDLWASVQAEDYAPPSPSELSADFEKRLRGSPSYFDWVWTPEDDKPTAIRWNGWGSAVGRSMKKWTELSGGHISIARDGVTEITHPLIRLDDSRDQRELDRLDMILPRLLGIEGRFFPFEAMKSARKAAMAVHVPTIVTFVNTPVARRHPLDEIERMLGATYFKIVLRKRRK